MRRQNSGALRAVDQVLGQHAGPERPAPPEHVGEAARPLVAGPPVDPLVRGRGDGHEAIARPPHGACEVEQGILVEGQERGAAHALGPPAAPWTAASCRGRKGQVQSASTARPLYWRAPETSPWAASIGLSEPE